MTTQATRAVGAPHTRVEGREKVTGAARYAVMPKRESIIISPGRPKTSTDEPTI